MDLEVAWRICRCLALQFRNKSGRGPTELILLSGTDGFSQGPLPEQRLKQSWSLSSSELNYNKCKAKSVVLALTVYDQILQKCEYSMAWMPVFLYSQNTQGAELESLPEGTKPKQRICFKNDFFPAFSPQFSGLLHVRAVK